MVSPSFQRERYLAFNLLEKFRTWEATNELMAETAEHAVHLQGVGDVFAVDCQHDCVHGLLEEIFLDYRDSGSRHASTLVQMPKMAF